jgi:hypothetical protein
MSLVLHILNFHCVFTHYPFAVECGFVMNTLPSSIESYLEEAGFTVLEVLILKRLLEEEALTVREIASKTGKSSGAIDQAMRICHEHIALQH